MKIEENTPGHSGGNAWIASLAALRWVYFVAYYVAWWGAVTGVACLAILVLMMLGSRFKLDSQIYGFVGIPAGLLLFVPVARRALRDRYLHRYLLGIGIGGFIAVIPLGIHFYRASKALQGVMLFGGLQELIITFVCFIFGVFFVVTAVAGAAGIALGRDITAPSDQPPASSHVLAITGCLVAMLVGAGWLINSYKTRQLHALEQAKLEAWKQAYAQAHPKPKVPMVEVGYASNCFDDACSWFDAVDYCKEKKRGLPGVKELRGMVKADCVGGELTKYAWAKVTRGDLALAVDLCSGKTREDIKTYGLNRVRCR